MSHRRYRSNYEDDSHRRYRSNYEDDSHRRDRSAYEDERALVRYVRPNQQQQQLMRRPRVRSQQPEEYMSVVKGVGVSIMSSVTRGGGGSGPDYRSGSVHRMEQMGSDMEHKAERRIHRQMERQTGGNLGYDMDSDDMGRDDMGRDDMEELVQLMIESKLSQMGYGDQLGYPSGRPGQYQSGQDPHCPRGQTSNYMHQGLPQANRPMPHDAARPPPGAQPYGQQQNFAPQPPLGGGYGQPGQRMAPQTHPPQAAQPSPFAQQPGYGQGHPGGQGPPPMSYPGPLAGGYAQGPPPVPRYPY